MQPLEVLPAIRRSAFFTVLWSILAFVIGIVLLAVGAVTGCVLCIAIPLTLGSILAGCYGLFLLVFPTFQLGHLGDAATRERAISEIEAQSRSPNATFRALKNGKMWILPEWLVMFVSTEVLIERRSDVLHSYRQVTNHTRYGITTRTSHAMKIRTRSRDYTIELDAAESDWVPAFVAQASPHAFAGYDPRTASMSREQLIAEVDRRR